MIKLTRKIIYLLAFLLLWFIYWLNL
jgi:hypothetical protein